MPEAASYPCASRDRLPNFFSSCPANLGKSRCSNGRYPNCVEQGNSQVFCVCKNFTFFFPEIHLAHPRSIARYTRRGRTANFHEGPGDFAPRKYPLGRSEAGIRGRWRGRKPFSKIWGSRTRRKSFARSIPAAPLGRGWGRKLFFFFQKFRLLSTVFAPRRSPLGRSRPDSVRDGGGEKPFFFSFFFFPEIHLPPPRSIARYTRRGRTANFHGGPGDFAPRNSPLGRSEAGIRGRWWGRKLFSKILASRTPRKSFTRSIRGRNSRSRGWGPETFFFFREFRLLVRDFAP